MKPGDRGNAERAGRTDGEGPEQPADEAERFSRLLSGKWVVQAVSAAAELGVADELGEPLGVSELAERLGCQPRPLERLMKVLAGEGLVVELPSGHYALSSFGEQLRSGKARDLARFVGSHSQWAPWAELARAVRTGECAFELAHGKTLFEYLQDSPSESRLYDSAVDTFTSEQALALGRSPVLASARTVVDVGGGRGTLLLELLRNNPALHGTLLDLPHVVAEAKRRFEEAGLAERCTCLGGDFFDTLPPGADCYIIKHVLHNWSDDRAGALLQACRRAMPVDGRIIVVEGLLLPANYRDLSRFMDLEMMVLTGQGRERSKPEFRGLLHQAGLSLSRSIRLSAGAWALVAEVRRP